MREEISDVLDELSYADYFFVFVPSAILGAAMVSILVTGGISTGSVTVGALIGLVATIHAMFIHGPIDLPDVEPPIGRE